MKAAAEAEAEAAAATATARVVATWWVGGARAAAEARGEQAAE